MNEHLNKAQSFMDQDKAQLDKVRMQVMRLHLFIPEALLTFPQMVASYPILDNYENLWPLDLIMISQLKYTAAASKGSKTQKAMDTVRSMLTASNIASTKCGS